MLGQSTGRLYVVATPIGNLSDVTSRATQILADVDAVVVEDTRVSGKLLNYLGIKNKMLSLHAHNENTFSTQVIKKLLDGQDIALISDAGTPLISDPGFPLVRLARTNGIEVLTVPGPCAAIAALSISGIACDQFVFIGFLAAKQAARIKQLEAMATEHRTMVIYESPHRIEQSLTDMRTVFGDERQVSISRELTKQFEQTFQSHLADAVEWVNQSSNHRKGEFVVVLAGVNSHALTDSHQSDMLLKELIAELPPRKAAAIVSRLTGESKNELYQKALQLKGSN